MSPLPPDPYKALGVDKTADIAAIRSAHRKLVLKCHPDKVQDPKLKAEKTDEFQRIQQAYELLTDEDKLREYQEKLVKKASSGTRVHVSTPRQSTKQRSGEFEVRSSPGGHTRIFTTSRAYEDELNGGVYEVRSSKKSSFSTKSSFKRDSEKRREKKDEEARRYRQDLSDAEREAAREVRRAEKERRDVERKLKEKVRDKQKRTGTEDKHMRFTDTFYAEPREISPKPDRKKSSSRSKYADGYEYFVPEEVIYSRRPAMTTRTYSAVETPLERNAKSYISRSSSSRVPPPVPTPPPKAKSGSYKQPDVQSDSEDYDSNVHRSRAQRRSSSGRSADRDRRRASDDEAREVREDPVMATPSSATQRAAPAFQRSTSSAASPGLASPPRDMPRTRRTTSSFENSPRGPTKLGRAETFDVNDLPSYGRHRSKYQAQVEVELSDDEDYDRHHSSSRRSSRRTPELQREPSSRFRREPSRLQRSESYADYVDYEGSGSYEMLYDKHGNPCPVRFTDRPSFPRHTSYFSSPSMSRDAYASPAMSPYPIDGARYSRSSRDAAIRA